MCIFNYANVIYEISFRSDSSKSIKIIRKIGMKEEWESTEILAQTHHFLFLCLDPNINESLFFRSLDLSLFFAFFST